VRRAAKSPPPVGGEAAPGLLGSAAPDLAVGGEMGREDI
jgi:hypothetical protein